MLRKKKNIYGIRNKKRKRRFSYQFPSFLHIGKKQLIQTLEVSIVLIVGLVTLALITSLFYILLIYLQRSPYFAVQHVEVKGNKRLSINRVLALSGISLGDNLVRIRLGSVYKNLYQSKWIQSVSVRKTWPDTIHIDLEELEASFWIQHDNTLYYADSLGFPITAVDKDFFVSLPVLEIEKGAEDFVIHLPAIMQELQKLTYPLDIKSISWIKLLSSATFQFFIESAHITVTIAIEGWQENIKKVQLVIHDLARRGELSTVRRIYANDVVLVEY